jgi:hypothetical protein
MVYQTDQVAKEVLVEGVKALVLGKTLETAGKTMSNTLGKTIADKAAFGGLVGSLSGAAATGLLQQATMHLPGLTNKVLDSMGRGGFQRGQVDAAETLLKMIKEASTVEMLSYLLGLVNINPNTRLLKNVVITSASVGGIYLGIQQVLKFQLAKKTTFLINESLAKQVSFKLHKLREAAKISEALMNKLEIDIIKSFNEKSLRNMLDELNKY